MDTLLSVEDSHVDLLHEIGVRLATADGFHEVLARVVDLLLRWSSAIPAWCTFWRAKT